VVVGLALVAMGPNQRFVIWGVVGRQDGWRRLKRVDQEADLVVCREVDRPQHVGHPSISERRLDLIQKCVGHGLVVHRLEEAEESRLGSPPVGEGRVYDGSDPSYHAPSGGGEVSVDRTPSKRGVVAWGPAPPLFSPQGWDPGGVLPIQHERQVTKRAMGRRRLHGGDLDLATWHKASLGTGECSVK